MVWDDEVTVKYERIFIAEICGLKSPIVVVNPADENLFLNNSQFETTNWKHMKPLPIEPDFKSKDLMYSEQDMIEYSSYSLKLALEIIDTRVTPLILTPEEWKKEENKKQ